MAFAQHIGVKSLTVLVNGERITDGRSAIGLAAGASQGREARTTVVRFVIVRTRRPLIPATSARFSVTFSVVESADENFHTVEGEVSARNDTRTCTLLSVTSTVSSGLIPLIPAESPWSCNKTESPMDGAYRISAMGTGIALESGFAIADQSGAVVLKSTQVAAHPPLSATVMPDVVVELALTTGAITWSPLVHERVATAIPRKRSRTC